jgi:hypothetical protein
MSLLYMLVLENWIELRSVNLSDFASFFLQSFLVMFSLFISLFCLKRFCSSKGFLRWFYLVALGLYYSHGITVVIKSVF